MFKLNKVILCVLTLSISAFSVAQDIEYARKCIQILSSPQMKGRGYVGNADKKAAAFIRKEYQKIGVQAFSASYYQEFQFSVNSYPSKMIVKLDGEKLEAGADYLIIPSSPGIQGEFPARIMKGYEGLEQTLEWIRSEQSPFVLAIDWKSLKKALNKEEVKELRGLLNKMQQTGLGQLAGILDVQEDKLTWTGSRLVHAIPRFTIKQDVFSVKENSKFYFRVKNKFHEQYLSQNVIGYLPGESSDSLVLITAHYDHLGKMGKKCYFPGANDNASGVTLMLDLARKFKAEKQKYDIVFIAFGAEEIGLLGSDYFVKNPWFDLNRIRFLINLDLAGTGDDGIKVVNGSIYRKEFDRLQNLNEDKELLTAVKIRGEACNSDHCHFHAHNVPSFFIYTLGGIKAYHDIYDKSETLPLTSYNEYFTLLFDFIESL